MTIEPGKLRTCIESGAKALIVDAADMPMIADALEIADSCARADIESCCTARGEGDDYRAWWWDTSSTESEDDAMVAQALRYCEARGLIERHPTDAPLVRFKREAA